MLYYPERLDEVQREQSLIGKTLNRAGIPCVAWGRIVLELMGSRFPSYNYCFIVPDDQVQDAKEALLRDAGGDLITPWEICSVDNCSSSDPFLEVVPDAHLHVALPPLDPYSPHIPRPRTHILRQSRVLWALPTLDRRLLPPPFGDSKDMEAFRKALSPQFATSNDMSVWFPRIYDFGCRLHGTKNKKTQKWVVGWHHGPGTWSEDLYPLIAPKPHLVVEAYVRIHVRMFCYNGVNDSMHSVDEMTDLAEAHKRDRYLDLSAMDPLVSWFWLPPKGETKGVREMTLVLARHLGEDEVARILQGSLDRKPTILGY